MKLIFLSFFFFIFKYHHVEPFFYLKLFINLKFGQRFVVLNFGFKLQWFTSGLRFVPYYTVMQQRFIRLQEISLTVVKCSMNERETILFANWRWSFINYFAFFTNLIRFIRFEWGSHRSNKTDTRGFIFFDFQV